MLNLIPLLNSHYLWASSCIAPSIITSSFHDSSLGSCHLHLSTLVALHTLQSPCSFTPPCLCGGLDNHTACILMPTSIIAATTLMTCTYICPTLVACSLQQMVWQTPNLKPISMYHSLDPPFPLRLSPIILDWTTTNNRNIGQLKWLTSTSPYNHLLHF